jgi:hypothetical protein
VGTPIITVALGRRRTISSLSKRGRKMSEPPAARVTLVATNRPWVWKIGSAWSSRSSAVKRHASRKVSAFEARLPWLSMAPLERPVVPEV